MTPIAIRKEKAQHTGLATTAAIAAVWIIFSRSTFDFLSIIASALIGVLAYSLAYIYLLNTLEGMFYLGEEEYEEEAAPWTDPEPQQLGGDRIYANGRVIPVPSALANGIMSILMHKMAGDLDTISNRKIHDLGIASRFATDPEEVSAQDLMDWLIEEGLVEQKPNSVGTWTASPTPAGAARTNGSYSTTATTSPPSPPLTTTN